MDKKQAAFLLELLADFKIEAAEHHQAIVAGLLILEKSPAAPELQPLIESVFREIHSLKGAARAVNQLEFERLCQTIEGVFHHAKQGNIALSPLMFDTLYTAVDTLGVMLSEVDLNEKSVRANTLAHLMKRIEELQHTKEPTVKSDFTEQPRVALAEPSKAPPEPAPAPVPDQQSVQPATVTTEKQGSQDTVRITTSKLGILLREAEEFISVKATLGFFIKEIKKTHDKGQHALVKEMEQFHRSMSRMVDDLLIDIKATLLQPFSTLLEIVPKIVRDLGKTHGKEILLSIHGGEIEIDRRILEEIKDPLIHLIRNSIDHGIEMATVRKQAGKAPSGTLKITISQVSAREVELRIQDDGAGIDKERLIQSAIKMGIVTQDSVSRFTDTEIYAFVFRSGISTSPFITDISGRGLGMAIVAEKVSKLGGGIVVDSVPGQGTAFVITLPVTLSTFRGLLVQVSDQFFIIPTNLVERAIRIRKQDIKSVESKQIIIQNGESIALVSVAEVLGIALRKSKRDAALPLPVLILNVAQRRIAFLIDDALGEHEGMVKSLGPQLLHVRNFAGATILGNGRVIPILNVHELMDSAVQVMQTSMGSTMPEEEEKTAGQLNSILIAEDSITLRSLLRNIVESAGYVVKTAVDGMEAFQFLQAGGFDLVVSDVEMPRMNGFDLTAKIRGDKRLAETPVILVTALDTAADRQRGMESGANAYIVKSSFEQSNLIEMIKRLI